MRDLNGRVAVVTGAGSGIGKATATAFAREGMKVHLVDIDQTRVAEAAEEIGGTPHVVDCTDGAAIQALADEVIAAEGRVDVVHNNAGVGLGKPFERTTLEDWKWLVDLNLWGVIHGCRAFLPHMAERGEGAVVNSASLAGLVGFRHVAAYATTKHAVVGLSDSLNQEYGPRGVTVMALCPGLVNTNIQHDGRYDIPEDPDASRLVQLFEERGISPDDVAAAVVDGIKRKRWLVVVPRSARAIFGAKRWNPWKMGNWLQRIEGWVAR